ncbi:MULTISPECIES: MtrAB system histidine kinase MtrB [Brevibacterium]|uniref:MtrAB system histidine kinase MtrB n=1 Tax=Brevibacterium TaxID=1696 RepID=UPI00103B22E7|nr:MtrAB system histidine kinase MtrB [Brevibacterium casei]NJE65903.1 HAMP domain-containing histidine kinase [Brevibacterium sp. LS14]MBE4695693.1 HAMP domain-containing histidine kinase [Brevibacterium casei]MBY3578815.1 HAMP domain-containing histidine kinase [Brevibacterium casei]MCT1447782.1 MtrAB system histidine kinase MtrB [Brevibacterium casei]MCT1766817.1 MtrAB system histidine kinase MtrB [Brevibacterium casei]
MKPSSAVRGALRTTAESLKTFWEFVRRSFSYSLQVRIVVLTIILTSVAIFGVGTYMSQQISRGLFDTRLDSLSGQASNIVSELRSVAPADGQAITQENLSAQLSSIYNRSTGSVYALSLEPKDPNSAFSTISAGMDSSAGSVSAMPVSDDLQAAIGQAPTDDMLYQSVSLPGDAGPGLLITQELTIPGAGQFQLYYLGDLREQQNTLDFVQRSMLVAALVLVVLVGAVAWIVTRLVVTPVRTGAEVARLIADGDLDERMPVHGNDEIAVLGESFNDMADTLQHQIQQMERLSVLQRQFVSDVSHELRTPLATIRAAADLIYDARDDLDPVTARSAELLNSQAERFDSLLSDLLEISRYDAGAAALVAKPVDVCAIVTSVIENVSMVADQMSTHIVVHAPSSPVMAEIDRVRITRIIRNLVVNAIEHGEGKPIDVYVASNAEAVAVSVRDHGVGMNEEQVEHVFDRFWRADPARKRTLGGSGLGLAISLEDAHLHNGWLQVWGNPGEGSCFRLTIPRRPDQEITSSPLPLPPRDAQIRGAALVAGPLSSDGSVRIQTGSIPIVVETEPDADAAPERSGGRTAQAAPAAAATAPEQSGARHAAAQQPATAATGTVEEPPAETQEGRP